MPLRPGYGMCFRFSRRWGRYIRRLRRAATVPSLPRRSASSCRVSLSMRCRPDGCLRRLRSLRSRVLRACLPVRRSRGPAVRSCPQFPPNPSGVPSSVHRSPPLPLRRGSANLPSAALFLRQQQSAADSLCMRWSLCFLWGLLLSSFRPGRLLHPRCCLSVLQPLRSLR